MGVEGIMRQANLSKSNTMHAKINQDKADSRQSRGRKEVKNLNKQRVMLFKSPEDVLHASCNEICFP